MLFLPEVYEVNLFFLALVYFGDQTFCVSFVLIQVGAERTLFSLMLSFSSISSSEWWCQKVAYLPYWSVLPNFAQHIHVYIWAFPKTPNLKA